MKAGIAVAVALLTASPFAILALDAMGVGPAFEAVPPEWEAGYTWTWDVTGRGRAVGEGFGVVRVESENLRVEATRQAQVLNTTLEENGVPFDLVLEAFRVDQVQYGDKVVYEDGEGDQAPMDGGMFTETFFCLTVCQTALAPYTEDGNPYLGSKALDEVGDDRVRLLDFPLTRGKEWSVIQVDEDEVGFEIRAKAVDNEYLDLPDFAPMQTVRIEAGLTEATKTAIKQLAKQEAEAEGFDIDLDFDLVMTYWYSPELQNIVKLDLDGFLAGRGNGYGAAGAGRIDFHLDQVLTEASLVPTRERTLEEAEALAEATWASGGEAQQPSRQSWVFSAVSETASVDADLGHSVQFGLVHGELQDGAHVSHRFETPPEGVRAEWTHRWTTADGIQTETATGPGVDFTIDAPGQHVVTAQLFDADGRIMGADSIVIEGYTKRTFTLDDPVALGAITAPHRESFFIAPGASMVNVALGTDGYADGRILLEGMNAAAQDATIVKDHEHFTFEGLESGHHEIAWQDDTRAGELEVMFEVRYATDTVEMPLGEPARAPFGLPLGDLLGFLQA